MSKIITDLNCRVCLEVEELMVHIFEEVEDLQSNLSTLLEECGGIKVDQSDCHPKYLCQECTGELLIAAKFREKCERAQQVLREIDQLREQTEETEEMTVDTEHTLNASNAEDEEQILMKLYEEEPPENDTSNMQQILFTVVEEKDEETDVIAEQVPQIFTYDTESNVDNETGQIYEENELIVFGIEDAVDTAREPEVYVAPEDHKNVAQQQHSEKTENSNRELQENHLETTTIYTIASEKYSIAPKVTAPLPSAARNFACDICGALFLQPFNLKRHMERLHLLQQYFTCQKCELCFSQETLYAQHYSSCDYRSVSDSRKRKAKANHAKPPAHTSAVGKPSLFSSVELLECSYCGKQFKSSFACNMHLRTHTGERPFSCEHCPKTFKIQSHLNTHLKRHAGLPDFACSVCGKAFYESSNLTVHMRTHTGERPHACSICSKRFTRVFLLQLHMRTHTGEKPYQCDECDRSFTQACDLKNHIRTHTGERNFKCPLCTKTFIKRHPMLKHMKKHSSLGLVVDVPQETMQEDETSVISDSFAIEQLDLVDEDL